MLRLLALFVWIVTGSVAVHAAGPESADPETPRPNLLLITLDTTRADHLGSYGYERKTSPRLDELARDALVFDRAYSTSSWTLPAHASLLTGKFPSSHGARYHRDGALGLGDGLPDESGILKRYRVDPLGSDGETLAELLGAEGYVTGAVVAGPWMLEVFGLGRGFQSYDDDEIVMADSAENVVRGRLAAQVSKRALDFIDANAERPFFLFLNFYDPHLPFSDPDGLASLFFPGGKSAYPVPKGILTMEEESAYYDGEIRYMDRFLGRVFDRLKKLDLYDRTWIIVTADHGELLGEQGGIISHGKSLYQGEVRIPLIVKYPKGEGKSGRSDRFVQLTDIMPMVAERLAPEKKLSAAHPQQGDVFAEVYPSHLTLGDEDWLMLVSGEYKLLSKSNGERLLFDLSRDPREQKDLSADHSERVKAMNASLDAFLAGLPKAKGSEPRGEVDEETRRALESLGYLE